MVNKNKIEEFEDSEAKFMSKYILDKLGISISEGSAILTKDENFRDVVEGIEKIEDSWLYIPSVNDHSYGRKKSDEKIGLWSVPPMTANVLGYLVLNSASKNILEIGTSSGYSTLHLALGAKSTGGHVYTVELLDKKIELAKENFRKSRLESKITLIEDEASRVLSNCDFSLLDFVFLDADKENYSKYLDQVLPKMKVGGLLVADNINDYGHMMGDFLQRVSGTHLPCSRCDGRVKGAYVAQLDNGLMVVKKIGENKKC